VLKPNTSNHSRGGFLSTGLNSGNACRVSISDFRYAKGGKLQAFKKNCLAANAATSLHSRINLAARQMPGLHPEISHYAIGQELQASIVGSNPASPTKRGNSLMEKGISH
jgi:hypothetical protein